MSRLVIAQDLPAGAREIAQIAAVRSRTGVGIHVFLEKEGSDVTLLAQLAGVRLYLEMALPYMTAYIADRHRGEFAGVASVRPHTEMTPYVNLTLVLSRIGGLADLTTERFPVQKNDLLTDHLLVDHRHVERVKFFYRLLLLRCYKIGNFAEFFSILIVVLLLGVIVVVLLGVFFRDRSRFSEHPTLSRWRGYRLWRLNAFRRTR